MTEVATDGGSKDGETIHVRKTIVEENGVKFEIEEQVKRTQITKKVSKSVQRRRELKKFGVSAGTPKGATDPGSIFTGDEIILDLTPRNAHSSSAKDDAVAAKALAAAGAGGGAGAAAGGGAGGAGGAGDKGGNGIVMCRICGKTGDHWTLKCPLKDKLQGTSAVNDVQLGNSSSSSSSSSARGKPATVIAAAEAQKDLKSGGSGSGGGGGGATGAKYVPPSLRAGGAGERKGESMSSSSGRDDSNTVRVTNLSSDATEADVRELFSFCGKITRVYLARDSQNVSKGFAFVTYEMNESAQKAIAKLNGHGYDHLILSVAPARSEKDKDRA